MMYRYLGLTAMLISICFSQPVMAAENHKFSYQMRLNGDMVGKSQISYHRLNTADISAPDRWEIRKSGYIKLSGWWGTHQEVSQLRTKYRSDGVVENIDMKIKENESVYWSSLTLSGNEYLVFKSQIQNDVEKEADDITDLAQNLLTSLVPGAGSLMEMGTILISDDSGQSQQHRFPQKNLQSTILYLPFYWHRHQGKFTGNIALFDSDALSLMTYAIKDIGIAKTPTGEQTYNYQLTHADAGQIDIGFAYTQDGLPYLYQLKAQEGDDILVMTYQGATYAK